MTDQLNIEVQDFKGIDLWNKIPATDIPMLVVYNSPKDIPNKVVARLWGCGKEGAQPTRFVAVRDTLAQIHEVIPAGLEKFKRALIDDPVIVETWI